MTGVQAIKALRKALGSGGCGNYPACFRRQVIAMAFLLCCPFEREEFR